jgi:hypothetical protein
LKEGCRRVGGLKEGYREVGGRVEEGRGGSRRIELLAIHLQTFGQPLEIAHVVFQKGRVGGWEGYFR